jgi:hypothetical protein
VRRPIRRPDGAIAEQLERRLLLASVSVSTLADTSNGDTSSIANLIATPGPDGISLREAITAANNTAGADVVNFSVGGTVNVTSALPSLTGATSIIASTNGIPTVELNGASAGAGASGLVVNANGCTIRGLAVNRFAVDGIELFSGSNVVAGCYVGLDLTGTIARGNGEDGVYLQTGSGNQVGGTNVADRNVISSNGFGGIDIFSAPGAVIRGNYIGTTATGSAARPNLYGMFLQSISGTQIGGFTAQDRNVVSGNTLDGIQATSSNSTFIRGNYIGTTPDGNSPLGNQRNGVSVNGSANCVIGGDDAADGAADGTVGARNLLSGNVGAGVSVFGAGATNTSIRGNYCGTNAAGTAAVPNSSGILLTSRTGDNTPSSQTTIGGLTPGAGNLLSGNVQLGIQCFGGTHHNSIQGNLIGTNPTGTAALPNGTGALPTQLFAGYGILLDNGTADSVIGGDDDDDGALDGNVAARNIISGNARGGIKIEPPSTNNFISGNYIGLNLAGNAEVPNTGPGVLLENSGGNTVGGATDGAGNTISGNTTSGILITSGATNNNVFGNRIGANPAGLAAIGNHEYGVRILSAPGNFVGGPTATLGIGQGNVISGNFLSGVSLEGAGTTGNGVYGNLIGTTITGSTALPNSGDGVAIDAGASNNFVGATDQPGGQARNVLSGNFQNGVRIGETSTGNQILANRIGTSLTGLLAVPNTFAGVALFNAASNTVASENLISGNGTYGVYITGSSATGNTVKQSVVGLKINGNESLGNQRGGVFIEDAPGNIIGGSGAGNTISGNISSNGEGVRIRGLAASGNKVWGNLIGVNAAGAVAAGNFFGVSIEDAPNNEIGGSAAIAGTGLGNVISGNVGAGVLMTGVLASGNKIQGNVIGLDASGAADVGNLDGVRFVNSGLNVIGGATTTPGANLGNVISGNSEDGVAILGALSINNNLYGNLIGVARDGTTARGNREHGIRIADNADNNKIGSVNVNEANTIANNGALLGIKGHGIVVVSGTRNTIRKNSIYANAGRGIDLGDDSFTPNDLGAPPQYPDLDDGANMLMNYPFVRSVDFIGGGQKKVTFELHSLPLLSYIFDFFSVDAPDASGFGEGQRFLATASISADDEGLVLYTLNTPVSNTFISATATDEFGNTSEFSMVDTDADGLGDAWESFGVDVNEDGTKDQFLVDSNPMKKDVYVEVDAMVNRGPQFDALNDVVASYANAPAASVDNPDGSAGISLHWEFGGDWDIPNVPWKQKDSSGYYKGFAGTKLQRFGTPLDRALPNWTVAGRQARLMTYRYCVFAESVEDDAGGVAEGFSSNDFFIALGKWKERFERNTQAGAFMHELGHTLGLHHGGADEVNFKPNYFSVMNYVWASGPIEGLRSSWVLDYSRVKQPDIDEDEVDEQAGLGGDPMRKTLIGPPYEVSNPLQLKERVVPQAGAYDFDNDGAIDTAPTGVDMNFLSDTNQDGAKTFDDFTIGDLLEGYDDWSNLVYSFDRSRSSDMSDLMSHGAFLQLDSAGVGPGLLEFSNLDYDVEERAGVATISVVRSGGVDGAVSVQYQSVPGGSAAAPGDYATTDGTLNFADGEYLKTFTIPIVNDPAFEGTETVSLQILNPVGAPLGDVTTATLNITEPMIASLARTTLAVPEAGGTLPITVTLSGETGQTLGEPISLSLQDLLSDNAVPGVDYALPADPTVTFPAGSPVGATSTVDITLIDDYASDADRTINLSLSPIDSFGAVADPGPLNVRILDGAVQLTFAGAAEYDGNFRELNDAGQIGNDGGNGQILYTGSASGTALYDTSPSDGTATIDLFGGGTSKEVYSLDFRAVSDGGAGIYARVPNSSVGGYHLSLLVQNGNEQFVIWKNPSVTSPGSTDVSLAAAPAADFAAVDNWYTLVFTLQSDAAGTQVALDGKVFPQGTTSGAPLAEFSALDASSPFLAAGQAGFRLFDGSGPGAEMKMDNFGADVSLHVIPDQNVTLGTSHYLTALAVNGNATLLGGGNRLLVTRDLAVTGRLDLNDNDLIVRDGNFAAVRALVAQGFNGGAWAGAGGITSAAAAADLNGRTALACVSNADRGFSSFGGVSGLTASDVIVKYTYYGDGDLSGNVTLDDFTLFLNGYQTEKSTWMAGDYDYSGLVTLDDFTLFLKGYQRQGSQL